GVANAVAQPELDPGRPPSFQPDRLRLRSGHHAEIGPVHDRPQERLGAGPADAAPLVHLEIAAALVVAAVEIVGLADADLSSRVAERVENLPRDARPLDPPFAVGTMVVARPGEMVLGALEIGQHVVPRPTGIAEL